MCVTVRVAGPGRKQVEPCFLIPCTTNISPTIHTLFLTPNFNQPSKGNHLAPFLSSLHIQHSSFAPFSSIQKQKLAHYHSRSSLSTHSINHPEFTKWRRVTGLLTRMRLCACPSVSSRSHPPFHILLRSPVPIAHRSVTVRAKEDKASLTPREAYEGFHPTFTYPVRSSSVPPETGPADSHSFVTRFRALFLFFRALVVSRFTGRTRRYMVMMAWR